MRDTDDGDNGGGRDGGGEDAPRMLLLAINESYWLCEGKEFLNPMLLGRGYFPRPVHCIRCADIFELRRYIGPNRMVTDFWGINPDIVARLRRDNDLLEYAAPAVSPDGSGDTGPDDAGPDDVGPDDTGRGGPPPQTP